jgi:predicted MFS family arabinose efflux permease
MADQYNRVIQLFFGILIWSGSTAISAITNRFWELSITRIILGVGAVSFFFSLLIQRSMDLDFFFLMMNLI